MSWKSEREVHLSAAKPCLSSARTLFSVVLRDKVASTRLGLDNIKALIFHSGIATGMNIVYAAEKCSEFASIAGRWYDPGSRYKAA